VHHLVVLGRYVVALPFKVRYLWQQQQQGLSVALLECSGRHSYAQPHRPPRCNETAVAPIETAWDSWHLGTGKTSYGRVTAGLGTG
jgi:hypothetical protein